MVCGFQPSEGEALDPCAAGCLEKPDLLLGFDSFTTYERA